MKQHIDLLAASILTIIIAIALIIYLHTPDVEIGTALYCDQVACHEQ